MDSPANNADLAPLATAGAGDDYRSSLPISDPPNGPPANDLRPADSHRAALEAAQRRKGRRRPRAAAAVRGDRVKVIVANAASRAAVIDAAFGSIERTLKQHGQ